MQSSYNEKAEMISTERMVNTPNPFIIYKFYYTLEKASTLLSLSEMHFRNLPNIYNGTFHKINCFQLLTIFAKSSSLYVWICCEFVTEYDCQSAITKHMIVTKPLKYTSNIAIHAFLGDMSDRGTDTDNCSNT